MSAPSALLAGYNGANNTGAEALLQADITDVRAVLGPDARLTVPTLNAANLRRYLQPGPTLRIASIPTAFFVAVRTLVREHDLIVLVVAHATEILCRFGAAPEDVVLGTVNAGHPGGMLPLTRDSAASFHDNRLPDNLYVADASLLPESLGNPPILTIVAMAKPIGRLLAGEISTSAEVIRAS